MGIGQLSTLMKTMFSFYHIIFLPRKSESSHFPEIKGANFVRYTTFHRPKLAIFKNLKREYFNHILIDFVIRRFDAFSVLRMFPFPENPPIQR